MRAWDLNLTVEPASGTPMFLRIARAISNDVCRQRLRPGDRLPGTRTLAKALQVHRNTVVAAYNELLREGWIETKQAGSTCVSRTLPDVRPRALDSTCLTLSRAVSRSGILGVRSTWRAAYRIHALPLPRLWRARIDAPSGLPDPPSWTMAIRRATSGCDLRSPRWSPSRAGCRRRPTR